MAGLSLLDGTTAAIDFTLGGTATTNSVKAYFGYISATMTREMFEATTFASSGWRSRIPGLKQMVGSLAGYVSKGATYSDPLALFASTSSVAFVFTADSSCTLSGNLHAVTDANGMRAAAMSDRTINWESAGAVSSAWVVT